MLPAIRIKPGEKGRKILSHSEVCMHMKVAGKAMDFLLIDKQFPGVQLYNDDGSPFSGSILPSEAGIYRDNAGFYYYPDR